MTPDPKWLEVLKGLITTGGWYKLAIALACGLYLLLATYWKILPSPEAWEIRTAAFGTLLFGLLAAANLIVSANRFFPLDRWVIHSVQLHREKRAFRKYIPHMTETERRILAYLLRRNQKIFTAAADGGHAATLLALGFVRIVAQPGQQIYPERVPMTIPDHIWDVLEQRKDDFQYEEPIDGEGHPWRIHWMAR